MEFIKGKVINGELVTRDEQVTHPEEALTKEETKLPEGITRGYARWVIDEWQNVVNSATLTTKELDALDEQEEVK